MIIGITGGTGCGKTTLLKILQEQGCLILDCDAIYHELLRSDAEMLAAIEARFPGVTENGVLNRKKLGSIAFADEKALAELSRITHGAVIKEVHRRLESETQLAAIDAIALFESGLAALCDTTVAVTAPFEARVRRLIARDGICAEYAEKRIRAQHGEDWFRKKCDHILVNDGGLDAFRAKCVAFLRGLGIMEEKQ